MNKKIFFLLTVLVILTSAFFSFYQSSFFSSNLFNQVSYIQKHTFDPSDQKLNQVYDINMLLEQTPSGTTNTYLPNFKWADVDTVSYWQALFGMEEEGQIFEEDDRLYCADDSGRLTVYKNDGLLEFLPAGAAKRRRNKSELIISDQAAVNLAVKYVEEKFLFLSYEESEVSFHEDTFRIRFINRIGNIKNYAFNPVVELDGEGNLLGIFYYSMSYQRLSSCKIKSMEEAYDELPIDFAEGTSIDLKKCTLVYTYENSIVQPAYLFEGNFSDGRLFQSFVKAAVF